MKVVGFCGPSGVGKTTLIERLIPELKARGLRVSVVKHAHKGFDIDYVGKDSWRYRRAGGFEVVIASDHRLAKVREFEATAQVNVHQLLAELVECDWALVEGFKHADIPKIELLRSGQLEPALYPDDPFVVALATDVVADLPQPTARPVFGLTDSAALASYLMDTGSRHEYRFDDQV
jgi:molybdopterin-guanine dinucleotide biosynthesis protein B